ncbi:N-acetylneuraminate synthase family protein [Leptospira limi]|uniref:N-acetylneuraminate synthase family protein n=1 Tax=Leptospira limi TaxID=2950023 RepID=A0ABT3LZ18_9LEPT|nr:N-acetylneuraminate synthase family protein [Leptospira limi]MCW7462970.1 N-acetylneuraminate synthase family protein [Leptospira limi]
MNITKDISNFIVFSEESIASALKKISDSKSKIVFSVTENGVLEGVLTDGDFRRWLLQQTNIDLNIPVSNITNKKFKFFFYSDPTDKIATAFGNGVDYIPLIDKEHHLVAIAKRESELVKIGEFIIDDKSPAFVIAEIGNNHNGSIELAKRLVDEAIEAGADCIKFQMRNLESLYNNQGNADDASEDLGSQYVLDLLNKFQLNNESLFQVFDYCKSKGALPLCTPWDLESLEILEKYGMPAYKIASADLTNHELLSAVIKTGKTVICSTGMSSEDEIIESVGLMKHLGGNFILLHCNSTYPTPFKDVNLLYIHRLKEIGNCFVGYSGHERGTSIAIASVLLGAKVIEKHITLDKSMEGNDHKVSLLPSEFKAMVQGIREVEQSLGNRNLRVISQGEFMNREALAKSLVINCNLKEGETIKQEMISIKSPGKGLQPNRKKELIGRTAKRNFNAGDFFFASDLEEGIVKARNFKFKRPWGVPVRYHDFQSILSKTSPDLLEFHLSYKDMELDLNRFFKEPYKTLGYVVHSPELFAGDHLLDLCSKDKEYRMHSIAELQKVIEITKKLNHYFPSTTKPLIVTNVGGFTEDAPLSESERETLYEILVDSLSKLDQKEVEIIPQTMPPFPWHFGGQRYHNLFVDPDDTARFCEKYGYRVCFDTSHSKLACNHHRFSFKEFVEKVGPYTAHLHLADAVGVDGEGLQVGTGDIDFHALADDLTQNSPKASFIPEIWQGHKNEGEGFWIALDRMEKWF